MTWYGYSIDYLRPRSSDGGIVSLTRPPAGGMWRSKLVAAARGRRSPENESRVMDREVPSLATDPYCIASSPAGSIEECPDNIRWRSSRPVSELPIVAARATLACERCPLQTHKRTPRSLQGFSTHSQSVTAPSSLTQHPRLSDSHGVFSRSWTSRNSV